MVRTSTPRSLLPVAGLVLLLFTREALAHPLGNFAVCHYTRLQPSGDTVRVRYVLDFAEIPTLAEMERLDADRDGAVGAAEKESYLGRAVPEWVNGLHLTVQGRPAPLRQQRAKPQRRAAGEELAAAQVDRVRCDFGSLYVGSGFDQHEEIQLRCLPFEIEGRRRPRKRKCGLLTGF